MHLLKIFFITCHYSSCMRGLVQMILMVGMATQLIIGIRVWDVFMCCNTYIYIYILFVDLSLCTFWYHIFFMDIYTILCFCQYDLFISSLCLCRCTCMLNLSYVYIGKVIQFRCMFWMMSVNMLYILCSSMLFYFMCTLIVTEIEFMFYKLKLQFYLMFMLIISFPFEI